MRKKNNNNALVPRRPLDRFLLGTLSPSTVLRTLSEPNGESKGNMQ